MSDARCHREGKRAEHASPTGSSPRACRPQMLPTRLFTSQINSIIKDKSRARPKNSCRVSPESESRIKVEKEDDAGTPPMEPEKTPPPRPIFDHLSDREGPSGAEDDEDVHETLSVRRRNPTETIQVKVETTTVKEEPEQMPMAHSDETIQVMVSTPVAELESQGGMSSSSVLDATAEEVSYLKEDSTDLSPVSSSDNLGSPPINIADGGEESLLRETDTISNAEERESTLGGSECCKSEIRNSGKKHKSGSDRHGGKKKSHKSSSKSGRGSLQSYRISRNGGQRKKSKGSDLRRSKRQLSPVASRLSQERSLDHQDSTHQRRKRNRDSVEKPAKEGENSENDSVKGQYLSVATRSSSGRSDGAESSQSADEVFGYKSHSVSKYQSSDSCQSALNSQDSVLSKTSTAPDFIPLNSSLKPDTPYKIPTTPLPPMQYGFPFTPGYPPPQQFSYESWMSTPPPPPPPTMIQGRFHWGTVPVPMYPLQSPSPIQLISQPLPHTMFAPSQEDKRFLRLQSLHKPHKPDLFGYQLIGDSMLLRFSQQLLGEHIILTEGLRFLGYCVSGQKIGDLLRRLRSGFYHLGKRVVLMIGTNDLLRNTKSEQMCAELGRVVDHLRKVVEELVILTLPPVPIIEHMTHHWNRLNVYNDYIKKLPQKYRDARISVSDIFPLYVLSQEELEEEEMLAALNTEPPFCHGCLTCMEESEDDWDFSSLSDDDDVADISVLARTFINSNSPGIRPLDISGLFMDRRIPKCRRDLFELTFSDNNRKDLIHLNKKGLTVVKDQLMKIM